MTVNFVTEAVFDRDGQGRVWAIPGFGPALWDDQLSVFGRLRIVARVRAVAVSDKPQLIDQPAIALVPLPFYKGLRPFLTVLPRLLAALWRASALNGAFYLRIPGPLGTLLALMLQRRGRAYAVQLVGDPYQVMSAPGDVLAHRLRGAVTRATRRACRGAAVIAYVTSRVLQARYPAGNGADTHAFSDIDLPPRWFDAAPRVAPRDGPPVLFLCGSLAQLYKGVDTLIETLARLRDEGFAARAVVAGGGVFRPQLEELARARGLAEVVQFIGTVNADEVMRQLDGCDLFVMPSRTEGLPRALIEAFARGVPAIGSRIGGIPELLGDDELFEVDDVAGFAALVRAVWHDRERYRTMSRRNLARAAAFRPERLRDARHRFYRAVLALTA